MFPIKGGGVKFGGSDLLFRGVDAPVFVVKRAVRRKLFVSKGGYVEGGVYCVLGSRDPQLVVI